MNVNRTLCLLLFQLMIFGLYAQNGPTTDNGKSEQLENIKVSISLQKTEFQYEEPIEFFYSIYNNSLQSKRVLLKDLMGHPISSGVSIINEGDTSIVKYPSRQVFSSQVYSEEQIESFKFELPSYEAYGDIIDLQNIPVYKDSIRGNKLPVGKYRIRFHFGLIISNEIIITVIEK